MSKIVPLSKQVLLKTIPAKEKTDSGILLPQTAIEDHKPMIAEVVALGTSKKISKLGIKVGEQVIYSKYSGTEVEYNGEKFILVSYKDIIAKVS